MTQPRHQEAALEQLIELMVAEQEAADKALLAQQVSFSRVSSLVYRIDQAQKYSSD